MKKAKNVEIDKTKQPKHINNANGIKSNPHLN